MQSFAVLFVALCAFGISNALPDYIKPCSRSAKNFDQCCTERGNDALPHLLKGDSDLKLPNMLPMKLPKIDVDAGPNIKLGFTDVDVYGLDTVKLSTFHVNFDQSTIFIVVNAQKVTLIGKYAINGKIMVLPISGNGPANITINNSEFRYTFSFKKEEKHGKEYAKIDDDNLEWKIERAHFKFDDLFNGNQQMSDNVNTFLNENDQEVLKEIGAAVIGVVKFVARTIGASVLGSSPIDELFLA
uniref:Uncharacterized protein n=1 Tax=Dendroctonus ponderosae TaxID=77166 RepID=A0AAR5QFK0_DENPD